MKHSYYIYTIIAVIVFSSCKKQKTTVPSANIVHKVVNRTVKASDPEAMGVDINEDGQVDYSYFAAYVASSDAVHLYVGVNPLKDNATKMGEPDDNRFLNMGDAVAVTGGSSIKADIIPAKQWSKEFAYLVIRRWETGGSKTFEGDWKDGSPKFMPLRLNVQGNIHFGWAKLAYDRTKEELTLVEYAWNKNTGQEINAGQI